MKAFTILFLAAQLFGGSNVWAQSNLYKPGDLSPFASISKRRFNNLVRDGSRGGQTPEQEKTAGSSDKLDPKIGAVVLSSYFAQATGKTTTVVALDDDGNPIPGGTSEATVTSAPVAGQDPWSPYQNKKMPIELSFNADIGPSFGIRPEVFFGRIGVNGGFSSENRDTHINAQDERVFANGKALSYGTDIVLIQDDNDSSGGHGVIYAFGRRYNVIGDYTLTEVDQTTSRHINVVAKNYSTNAVGIGAKGELRQNDDDIGYIGCYVEVMKMYNSYTLTDNRKSSFSQWRFQGGFTFGFNFRRW